MSDLVFGALITLAGVVLALVSFKTGAVAISGFSFSKDENPVGFYVAIVIDLILIGGGIVLMVRSF